MLKMFKTHRNTVGNLMIALMFVGGCIFMLTGSWNASETDAANSCCGGKTTETTLETGCCGGNGIAMGAESTDGCRGDSFMNSGSNAQCTCLGTNCGSCTSNNACSGGNKPGCKDNNNCKGTDRCGCDERICNNSSQCNGNCI